MVFSENCFRNRYPFRVYRQLESKYVDQFFRDGSLFLKTFEDFGKHEDEARCDKEEGSGVLCIKYKEITVKTKMQVGYTYLILCSSLLDTGNPLSSNYDSCFAITNIPQFCDEITIALSKKCNAPCFWLANPCIYKDDRILEVPGSIYDINYFPPSPNITNNLLFLKKTFHSTQYEYRLIFGIQKTEGLKSQILKAPNARQYCEKIR